MGYRREESGEYAHGTQIVVSSLSRLRELRGGGPGEDREQEANTSSLPASAGPALSWVSREMGGATPTLFSGC